MEIYNTIASLIGWPAIVAILLLAGGYAYWVMQGRSEVTKEENKWLKEQLTALKEDSPDILAERLAGRLRVMQEELERLNTDHKASQESIGEKEVELAEVKAQIGNLKNQLAKAQDLLQRVSEDGLVCPKCQAPLEVREYHSESWEYEDREYDVDHEFIRYECGTEIVDGNVYAKCERSDSQKQD